MKDCRRMRPSWRVRFFKAQVPFGIGHKRRQMTRLETRTEESTHVREYEQSIRLCAVKAVVFIYVEITDFDSRREV